MVADRTIRFALKLNMYGHPVDTPFDDFVHVAVAAEDLGFDAAFTIDHFFLPHTTTIGFSERADPDRPFFPEAWTSLAAIAAKTSRLRIGPQVTPMMRYHPALTAKLGANIDYLSKGRFVFQTGTGWNPREYLAYGMPYREEFSTRYGQMLEGIEMIDKLWTTDGPVTYEGEHYQLDEAPMWPKPVQRPRPPIWLGGSGKKTLRAVARYADAWTPAAPHYIGLTPEFYSGARADIERMASEDFDRDPADILWAALFFVVIDEDRDKAFERAEMLRRVEQWSDLSVDDLIERGIALVGDPDDCAKALRRFTDIGVSYFSLGFVPISSAAATIGSMSLFAREVMPRFA